MSLVTLAIAKYLRLYADDSKCMGHRGQSYFMRLIALSEKHRSASGISHMNVPFGIIESHWWPTVRLLSLLDIRSSDAE